MHKKFFRILVFIVGMTLTLGASPTIAMDDEETPYFKEKPRRLNVLNMHYNPFFYQNLQNDAFFERKTI